MGEPNNLQEVREDHKRVIGGEVNTAWGAGLGRTRVPARYRRVAVGELGGSVSFRTDPSQHGGTYSRDGSIVCDFA